MDNLEQISEEELRFLGKKVNVIIDRPIHSLHPKFDFEYKLNYGFIPNTTGGDGEEIDAYIIGETKPIVQFEGIVKAVIKRYNDCENKLIVTPVDYSLTKEEIERKTHFQEQYFEIEIKLIEK